MRLFNIGIADRSVWVVVLVRLGARMDPFPLDNARIPSAPAHASSKILWACYPEVIQWG